MAAPRQRSSIDQGAPRGVRPAKRRRAHHTPHASSRRRRRGRRPQPEPHRRARGRRSTCTIRRRCRCRRPAPAPTPGAGAPRRDRTTWHRAGRARRRRARAARRRPWRSSLSALQEDERAVEAAQHLEIAGDGSAGRGIDGQIGEDGAAACRGAPSPVQARNGSQGSGDRSATGRAARATACGADSRPPSPPGPAAPPAPASAGDRTA